MSTSLFLWVIGRSEGTKSHPDLNPATLFLIVTDEGGPLYDLNMLIRRKPYREDVFGCGEDITVYSAMGSHTIFPHVHAQGLFLLHVRVERSFPV